MQKFPMTVQGHAALETELKHLKTVERPEIINAMNPNSHSRKSSTRARCQAIWSALAQR